MRRSAASRRPSAAEGRDSRVRVILHRSHRVATAVLGLGLASLLAPGCVSEPRHENASTRGNRAVSVELRRAITGVGYSGVLFTPLDEKGGERSGFTPSEYDIARMEARLPQILREAGPRLFAAESPSLARYRRQYSGERSGKQRIIQANFIHEDLIAERDIDWKHRRVAIRDAGSRAFQLWYDADAARILQLRPNP